MVRTLCATLAVIGLTLSLAATAQASLVRPAISGHDMHGKGGVAMSLFGALLRPSGTPPPWMGPTADGPWANWHLAALRGDDPAAIALWAKKPRDLAGDHSAFHSLSRQAGSDGKGRHRGGMVPDGVKTAGPIGVLPGDWPPQRAAGGKRGAIDTPRNGGAPLHLSGTGPGGGFLDERDGPGGGLSGPAMGRAALATAGTHGVSAPPAIPLPAGLPLLLAGIGAIGVLRLRQTRAG